MFKDDSFKNSEGSTSFPSQRETVEQKNENGRKYSVDQDNVSMTTQQRREKHFKGVFVDLKPVDRQPRRMEKPQKPITPPPPQPPERYTYDNRLIMQRGEKLVKNIDNGKYLLFDTKGFVISKTNSREPLVVPLDENGKPLLRDGDTLGDDGSLVLTPEEEVEYLKQKEIEEKAREAMEKNYRKELEDYEAQKECITEEEEYKTPLMLRFSYISASAYLFSGIAVLVFAIFILIMQSPPTLSVLSFVIGIFFVVAFCVQCFPFCLTKNRPVYHTVIILVGGFVVIFALMIACIQVFLSRWTWDYAVDIFAVNYLKYDFKYKTASSISRLVDDGHYLNYTASIVIVFLSLGCFILAFIQCLCYVSRSWGLFGVCAALPLLTVFLSVGMGLLFLVLYPSTPFASQDPVVKIEDFANGCPAGNYFIRTVVINFLIAAAFFVYVIVSCLCSCCYSHQTSHWPPAADVTYKYFRKSNYSLPFRPKARNTMAIFAGVMGLIALLVILINIPKKQYELTDAKTFLKEYCDECLNNKKCASKKQRKSCESTSDSFLAYYSVSKNISVSTMDYLPEYLRRIVQTSRKLVISGTFITIIPVLGATAYCLCILLIHIFYLIFPMETDDSQESLQDDVDDWNRRAGKCRVYGEYISLVAEKKNIDRRIHRYNKRTI